jgi:hypothetical protein
MSIENKLIFIESPKNNLVNKFVSDVHDIEFFFPNDNNTIESCINNISRPLSNEKYIELLSDLIKINKICGDLINYDNVKDPIEIALPLKLTKWIKHQRYINNKLNDLNPFHSSDDTLSVYLN